MPKTSKLGIASLVLVALAAVWLFVAPSVTGYVDAGEPWDTATRNHVITGVVLAVTAVGTLVGYTALALREALRRADGEPGEVLALD